MEIHGLVSGITFLLEIIKKWGCNGTLTGQTRCEACGSMCKLLLIDMVKNTGRVEQMANRYIEGKADENSSKQALSSIGEQYPEGLTRANPGTPAMVQAGANRVQKEGKGLIQYTRQKVRNQITKQHEKTRLKLK